MGSVSDPFDKERPLARQRRRTTVPNRELVVYALYLLGGASKRIHTEDVARKAHQLFPDSFSWTRYPEFPDKDIVRVALTDARKAQYGGLIDGRTGQHRGHSSKTKRDPVLDGWALSDAGIEWMLLNEAKLDKLAGSDSGPKEHRQKVLKQLGRIRRHPLFASFAKDPERFTPDIGNLAALLRCRVDADTSVWSKRLDQLRRKAKIAQQDDIVAFVDLCEAYYRTQS